MTDTIRIHLTNTLTRTKEEFIPIDPSHVRMYACGPTVYDYAHLGNARAAVVYDMLFKLLKELYPKVTYVRNITDVDDKIINACKGSGEDAAALTARFTEYYEEDMSSLNCCSPTHEPKATAYIPQMISMIEQLIANGHAYVNAGHVLFRVSSYSEYGALSRRNTDELIAGARVEVAPYKESPMDFVLWKPSLKGEERFGFDSPWGRGRPGWHIECSAMSRDLLGENFDIHGGGADLMFPHHENEIAQSVCCSKHAKFANYWVHNGFLMVGGEKMSKSLGNFFTVRQMLEKGIDGNVLRIAYLSTHYRKPIDFTEKLLHDSESIFKKFVRALEDANVPAQRDELFLAMLADDLNTPKAIAYALELVTTANDESKAMLKYVLSVLGIKVKAEDVPLHVIALAERRLDAKRDKDYALSDLLRTKIEELGFVIEDLKDGYKLHKK